MKTATESDAVGVVGLGAIGGPVARAVHAAGWRVVCYDVRREAFEEFPEAQLAPSPAELAAQARTVLVAVYDDEQLREVLTGPGGILAAQPAPATVCVLSTVTLATLRWAAAQAEPAGVELIDCGVTGGSGLRTRGKIVVLAGGSERAVASVRPVLEAFAAPLMHMGALGAGMQAKLARNLMHYSGWHAAWEAARIAKACGIDIQQLVEAHRISNETSSGGGTSLLRSGIGPGRADYSDQASIAARERSAAYAKKDLGYVLELAAELGIDLPGAELVRDQVDRVVGLGGDAAAAGVRFADMDPELQRLVDESAIRRLLARYSRAIDRRDYELLRTCYHHDAIDEHGHYDGDVDGFVEFLESRPPAPFEAHFLGNTLIDLDGDRADAETYCLALRRFPDEAGEQRDRFQHVRYHDRLEKRDGEWRIAHRIVSYGHGRIDAVAEATEFGEACVRDHRDRTDVVYRDGTPRAGTA